MPIHIAPSDLAVNVGGEVVLRLVSDGSEPSPGEATWAVVDSDGRPAGELLDARPPNVGGANTGSQETGQGGTQGEIAAREVVWRARDVQPGRYTVRVTTPAGESEQATIAVHAQPVTPTERVHEDLEELVHVDLQEPVHVDLQEPVRVNLQHADIRPTADMALWDLIKLGTEALSFRHYADWMKFLFCGTELPETAFSGRDRMRMDNFVSRDRQPASLPFPDMEGYKVLVAATQAFLEFNCEVVDDLPALSLSEQTSQELGLESGDNLRSLWRRYVENTGGTLPYLDRVRRNLGDDVKLTRDRMEGELCDRILERKFTSPCLLELIHTYWHEEGMLIQTVNAICMRFQNRRRLEGPDPLANLATDPLRPLSSLLWGYIQDEQHRLTVPRRAYEYDSEYGLTLVGQAVPRVRAAESRSGFLAAFHDLLHRASVFYKEDDDTTIIADAFPVLSALGEVHLLLAEGANNQWRGLTWTARCEMLIQQWLLARPEFREFLPTRVMVAYPEPWMDRVDAMKRMQGWTGTSVRYFRDLARFGEQLLLSIRYGDWSNVTNRDQAANWCRSWRQEVQWYIHAYQSVTGVDLSADMADVRQAEQAQARALPPAFHLQRRLAEQHRGNGAVSGGQAALYPGRPV
jgi:hypothetical protein